MRSCRHPARCVTGAVLACGTGWVLQRMARDFDAAQRLRPSTTALPYAVYVVDLAGLAWLTLRPA